MISLVFLSRTLLENHVKARKTAYITISPLLRPSRRILLLESSLNTLRFMESTMERGSYFFCFFALSAPSFSQFVSLSIAAVESVKKQGKVCILDIDVQGVQKVKDSSLTPLYLFIAPPSMEILEKRLRGRGTETEEQLKTRLGNAGKEMKYG